MFAVKTVNLITSATHYTPARDYADACQMMREFVRDCDPAWVENVDYKIDVVEVENDFNFEDQPDFN